MRFTVELQVKRTLQDDDGDDDLFSFVNLAGRQTASRSSVSTEPEVFMESKAASVQSL